uniref:FCP1 homology domain-containing protein n=1 Tax=Oryza nivara TaxID=4536 RepID=A0A0E0FQM6_ORYNI
MTSLPLTTPASKAREPPEARRLRVAFPPERAAGEKGGRRGRRGAPLLSLCLSSATSRGSLLSGGGRARADGRRGRFGGWGRDSGLNSLELTHSREVAGLGLRVGLTVIPPEGFIVSSTTLLKMPALRMKRNFDNDVFRDEFDSKPTKSMKISHFQVSELEQSAVLNLPYKDPHDELDLTTQLAGQDIMIMEAASLDDALGGASLLKDLISEVAVSPNMENDMLVNYEDIRSQLNVVNYFDKDEDANSASYNSCTVNCHEESWGSNEGCSLLDIYNPDDAFSFLLDTPSEFLGSFTALYDEVVPIDSLVNISGRCGVFPLTESTTEASIGNEPCRSEGDMLFSNSEVLEWLNPHLAEEDLPNLVDFTELNSHAVSKEQGARKVTLVLDLDETLVHSTTEQCDDYDFTFPVFFDMKEHMVYVRKRPHLHMFLQKMAEMFEVVIFTASQSVYADQLLDILDPEKKLFSRRYFRESCVFTNTSYTKDLTVVGVDLAKVVIIDNTPQLQVNNGIPIESWFSDDSDEALPQLIPFLETLASADDVRPIIAKKFGDKKDIVEIFQ